MANTSGKAYGLTALIPIKHGMIEHRTFDKKVREILDSWGTNEHSPMAAVANTYLCRFFVLNDVFYEGAPAVEEHLKNQYLVFHTNFHGALDDYLQGMWQQAKPALQTLLSHCVAFERNFSDQDFVHYIKRCQIDVSLFFNGSNDQPLAQQLKALYVKQTLSHFVFMSQEFRAQGELGARRLQQAFAQLLAYLQPDNLQQPTWPVATSEVPKTIQQDVQRIIDQSRENVQ